MALKDLTRNSVLQAVSEYDRLGREQFLLEYGYGAAKSYYLILDGKKYDSKAIAGVAHGYARPDVGPLAFSDFSGGQTQVQNLLAKLGFEVLVDSPARLQRSNPPWTRDELILALDYYLQNPNASHNDISPGVIALSGRIGALAKILGHSTSETLRNPNGVSMKLLNFRSHDPAYVLLGKVGLQRGNRLEKDLWDRFSNAPEELRQITSFIEMQIADPNKGLREALQNLEEPEIAEVDEGRIITRMHRFRERDRSIVQKKKESFLNRNGALYCEACGFNYRSKYGNRGEGFIECHHTKPVSSLGLGSKTKIADLVLLCANCHRMVHAKAPWLTIEELRALLS
jgi:5-methylcytosine-specific restriction protein A